MIKGQQKNQPQQKQKIVKKDPTFIQDLRPGSLIPERSTRELFLLKKIELKKSSGKILDLKYLKITELDDTSKFCIWVEIEDMKNPAKKIKPMRFIPHVAPHAINKLTGYFEKPGSPVIVTVSPTEKVFITFAPVQKNYKTTVRACSITYVRSTSLKHILSLKEIKKLNGSGK